MVSLSVFLLSFFLSFLISFFLSFFLSFLVSVESLFGFMTRYSFKFLDKCFLVLRCRLCSARLSVLVVSTYVQIYTLSFLSGVLTNFQGF